jgi:hypothetical protein
VDINAIGVQLSDDTVANANSAVDELQYHEETVSDESPYIALRRVNRLASTRSTIRHDDRQEANSHDVIFAELNSLDSVWQD